MSDCIEQPQSKRKMDIHLLGVIVFAAVNYKKLKSSSSAADKSKEDLDFLAALFSFGGKSLTDFLVSSVLL